MQRFLSEDPLGFGGGDVNLYAYVGNDPVGRRDPSGLDWVDDGLGAMADPAAGFGDAISGGLTAYIRGFTPGRKAVNEDSWGYFGGEFAAVAWEVAMAVASGGASAGAKGAAKGLCFVAGTKVQTAAGEKNIEEVRAGDQVLSSNMEGSALRLQRQEVVRTFEREAPVVLDIRVGGETITATPEHPFWVVGRGWAAAGELLPGYELLTLSGSTARVESVKRREGRFKVYNFEVANSHTYFVSPLGLLVHNQCRPTIKVKDLDPLHSPKTSGPRPALEKLSDSDLLESVMNPKNGDPLRISTKTGKVVDGNGRAYELMKRAADPNSSITPNTQVPYVPYTTGGLGFPPLP